jgi:ADP-ribose pyrophosphatase YjhB (NUDIX family)
MLEETGLEVEVDRLLELVYDEGQRVIVILYRVRRVGGTLAANDDVDAVQWFTRDDLPDLAFASTRRAVQAWLAEAR